MIHKCNLTPAVEALGENAEVAFIFNCGRNQFTSEDTNDQMYKKRIGKVQGLREFKGHKGAREFTRVQGRKRIDKSVRELTTVFTRKCESKRVFKAAKA